MKVQFAGLAAWRIDRHETDLDARLDIGVVRNVGENGLGVRPESGLKSLDRFEKQMSDRRVDTWGIL